MPGQLKQNKVVIIGAGPAGIAAAIQLKRYGIKPLVLERKQTGGLLNNANVVENYPGFPKTIRGTTLVCLFQKQLRNAGITVKHGSVNGVSFRNKMFRIKTKTANINSDFLVVASGTKPRKMTGCRAAGFLRNRIFYEVYPIRDIVKKRVVIIGSGDAAFDYALNLAQKNKVKILSRREKVKCLPILWKRAAINKNISYYAATTVFKITQTGKMLKLRCSNNKEMIAHYLLVAIGREPNLDFLSRAITKNKQKLVRQKKMYIIGDAKNGSYRQTGIAVGDGIRAAMEIHEKMQRSRGERENDEKTWKRRLRHGSKTVSGSKPRTGI